MGFFCSAAAAYPCPRGTWNNLTGQVDSSKCNSCPYPERMTTLSEAATSVDQCVCIATYYKEVDGSCVGEDGMEIETAPNFSGADIIQLESQAAAAKRQGGLYEQKWQRAKQIKN